MTTDHGRVGRRDLLRATAAGLTAVAAPVTPPWPRPPPWSDKPCGTAS
ncbi:twin-arginine translocation signal domain-containing protein [Streptomyces eurythermus]